MKGLIKVGICVAYDWEMLRTSLPLVYDNADIICLGLDQARKAWSGAPFVFDEAAFYAFVKEIDTAGKIDIYEDDFALPGLNTRENCNRQRTLIAARMGKGGWHIQIDADEYYLDFKGFRDYLVQLNPDPQPDQKPINVCCPFIPLIKRLPDGYLYVDFRDKPQEIIPMATNCPDYQRARQNGHFNNVSPYFVIHETWARSDDELWYKINNWGHASEELEAKQRRLSYFNLWKSLDAFNYEYVRDFHPAKATAWPALNFVAATDIQALIRNFPAQQLNMTPLQLKLKNNRNVARIRSVLKKINL